MAVPLRKDTAEEQLTTTDVARTGPSDQTAGPKPVASERSVSERTPTGSDTQTTPLFPSDELSNFRTRWSEIQTAFVDEPRRAVEQADGLVASAMKRLAEIFSEERTQLEQQWDQGDKVSTEDLRVAFQRYRTFFHRLLSM